MSTKKDKERLLDRSSYSTETITTYKILGSYIVGIYYDQLYEEAKKFKTSGKVVSITEGYKHAVYAFLSAIDDKSKSYKSDHYNILLNDINKYFITWTGFATLKLRDSIDKIVKQFIPKDYYDSLDQDQKRKILRKLLINSIKSFTKIVIQDFLVQIIDEHEDTDTNIHMLREKIIDVLILERESFYRLFLDKHLGKEADYVDRNLAVKMQSEIKTLINEKRKIHELYERTKKELEVRIEQLNEVISKYKELNKRYKFLKEEYTALKDKSASASALFESPDKFTTVAPTTTTIPAQLNTLSNKSSLLSAPMPVSVSTSKSTLTTMSTSAPTITSAPTSMSAPVFTSTSAPTSTSVPLTRKQKLANFKPKLDSDDEDELESEESKSDISDDEPEQPDQTKTSDTKGLTLADKISTKAVDTLSKMISDSVNESEKVETMDKLITEHTVQDSNTAINEKIKNIPKYNIDMGDAPSLNDIESIY